MPPLSCRIRAFAATLAMAVAGAPSAAGAASLSVDDAVRAAMDSSWELREAASEVAISRARARGTADVMLRDNPELEVSAGASVQGGDTGPAYGLAVSQAVELSGQRGARRDVADAGVAAAEARLQVRRWAVEAEVREAFARSLAAESRVAVAGEAFTLAERGLAAAQQREGAGAGSRIEVNAARVELGRARRESVAARQRHVAALADLRFVIGAEVGDEVQPIGDATTSAAPGAPPPMEVLLKRAMERRPEVQAARAEIALAGAEHKLAEREPALTPRFGASVEREERAHVVLATVGATLPFFNKNQAERAATRERIAQAEIALRATERRVSQEVLVAVQRYESARASLDASGGDAVEAARDNLRLSELGYSAGQLDLLHVLLLRRDALETRLAQIDALEEVQIAAAQLRRATGGAP